MDQLWIRGLLEVKITLKSRLACWRVGETIIVMFVAMPPGVGSIAVYPKTWWSLPEWRDTGHEIFWKRTRNRRNRLSIAWLLEKKKVRFLFGCRFSEREWLRYIIFTKLKNWSKVCACFSMHNEFRLCRDNDLLDMSSLLPFHRWPAAQQSDHQQAS